MNEQPESPAAISAHRGRGMAYAIAAAALAAAFLFLPVLLLGFTIQVVASVATGDILAWQSSVGLTYAILGPFALVSLILLLIPFRLWQLAAGNLGRSRATRWVGGLLAAALAGVAMVWLVQALMRAPYASQPEYWYALAFALAAIVVMLATALLARGATIAAIAVLGSALAGVVVIGIALVAVWGSPARIPDNAQTVEITSTPSGVEIQPDSVSAGTVYFVADAADDLSGHGEVSFVSAGYSQASDDPEQLVPLTKGGILGLTLGDYGVTSIESTLPGVSKLELREGYYAFVVFGPGGELPGEPPQSVAVLEVRP